MKVWDIVEVILNLNGGRQFEETCDQLVAGDWEREVTGIVTTFMATVDVIRKTIETGCNLIITHEPTYFTGADTTDWLENDPVYLKKKALIEENGIAIWRYHDHMHGGYRDIIYAGLLQDLGWEEYLEKNIPMPHCYAIPPMTVPSLTALLKEKLGMNVIKVIGDTSLTCRRVGILVGGGSLGLGVEEMPAKLMHDENLDAMICGEITEWTLSAYVRDAAALGEKKVMLIVGHERSEEPGMKYLVEVLRPMLGGTRVEFIDSEEPFTYL